MSEEAERLAQALDAVVHDFPILQSREIVRSAAAVIRRLSAENPVLHDCIESLTDRLKVAEEVAAALSNNRDEVLAWRERFPAYVYRPQDDCVSLRLDQAIGRT